MQGKAATLPDLAGRLGLATAKALVRLWEWLREIASFMRQEFGRAYREARGSPFPTVRKPIRGLGFFLVCVQAIAVVALSSRDDWTSGRALFNPVTPAIAISLLWSFPSVWRRFSPIIQKLLLM